MNKNAHAFEASVPKAADLVVVNVVHVQSEGDGQKIPDELLSTVLKSKGGPKPFSYGVDLNELKK